MRRRNLRSAVMPTITIVVMLLAGLSATYAAVSNHALTPAPISGAPAANDRPGPQAAPRRHAGHIRPFRSPPVSPSAMPAPGSPLELAQVSQITALLQRSAAIRTFLGQTTRGVATCTMPATVGLSRIAAVIQARTGMLSSVLSSAMSAIPDGEQIRSELVAATRFSLAADSEFAAWMRVLPRAGSCPVPTISSSLYLAAIEDSTMADGAKFEFLQRWNPLAISLAQPSFGSGQI